MSSPAPFSAGPPPDRRPKALAEEGDDDDENDPVVASYSVFIKPPLPQNRKIIVLQYLNKTSHDTSHIRPPRISEMRIKPNTGMVEVDVPLDTGIAYDKNKGVAWGVALQKSMETKKGGSLGLAGGFGINAAANRGAAGGRRGGPNNAGEENLPWQEALRQDKVLRTQTLGGGREVDEQDTRQFVGVFQGGTFFHSPSCAYPSLHNTDFALLN